MHGATARPGADHKPFPLKPPVQPRWKLNRECSTRVRHNNVDRKGRCSSLGDVPWEAGEGVPTRPLSRSRGQMSLWAVHMEPLLKANTRSLDTSRNHPLSNNKETSPQNGPGSTSPSLFRARLNTCELTNAHTDVQVHNEKVPYLGVHTSAHLPRRRTLIQIHHHIPDEEFILLESMANLVALWSVCITCKRLLYLN